MGWKPGTPNIRRTRRRHSCAGRMSSAWWSPRAATTTAPECTRTASSATGRCRRIVSPPSNSARKRIATKDRGRPRLSRLVEWSMIVIQQDDVLDGHRPGILGDRISDVDPAELERQQRRGAVCEPDVPRIRGRSEEHTSELQSRLHLVCRLLLEKKKTKHK